MNEQMLLMREVFPSAFEGLVNEHLKNGWQVVPGTLNVVSRHSERDPSRYITVCTVVLERDEQQESET